jgi:hypothetical protein
MSQTIGKIEFGPHTIVMSGRVVEQPKSVFGVEVATLIRAPADIARIAELEAALKEARGMLRSCGLDEPDDEYQAMWDKGLAKIDAALASVSI